MNINSLILKLEVEEYRLSAIRELTKLKSVSAVPALIQLLYKDQFTNYSCKTEIINSLVQISELSVIPVLAELLVTAEESSELAFHQYIISIIEALGIFNGEEYSNTIIPFLSHEVETVRIAALRTLTLFKWTPNHIQNKIRWLTAKGTLDKIDISGKAIVKPLIALTQDFNIYGCEKMMHLLALTGDERALGHILRWLFQPFYILHYPEQIEELVPSFLPLLGKHCSTILKASSFVDKVSFSKPSDVNFNYSLKTAIMATQKMKESEDKIAQKALKFVHLKKPVELTTIKLKEKEDQFILFDFEKQKTLLNHSD